MLKYALITILLLFTPSAVSAGSLILLVDTSVSIDDMEFEIQRNGYIDALNELEYILDGEKITIVTFSNEATFHLTNGTLEEAVYVFENLQKANGFDSYGDRTSSAITEFSINRAATCLYNALEDVQDRLDTFEQPIVIDVSGDGIENCVDINNLDITRLHDETNINAISFGDASANVYRFYDEYIANGFVMQVPIMEDFSRSLRLKIGLEVAMMGVDNRG